MFFSTRSIQKADRKQSWLEAWTSVCGEFDVEFGSGNFSGEVDARSVAGLDAIRIMQTSRGASRTKSMLPSVDLGYILILQCTGRTILNIAGRETTISPGQAVLGDSLVPLTSKYSGKNIAVSYHIPRVELERRLAGVPHAEPIALHGPNHPLLHSALISAFEMGAVLSPAASDSFRSFLFDLLVDCICDAPDRESDPISPERGVPLNGRIKEFALNNLTSDHLSPAFIASEFNVSQRQIHRAFEAEGVSVSRWIKKARLHRCALNLRQQSEDARSITDIAFEMGFRDLPHFSRSFRDEFGVSPSDYRIQCGNELGGPSH